MSRTEINRACGAGKHRPEYFADRAPSPSQGEGNGAVGFGRGAKKPI
jgi:hypothetical protein